MKQEYRTLASSDNHISEGASLYGRGEQKSSSSNCCRYVTLLFVIVLGLALFLSFRHRYAKMEKPKPDVPICKDTRWCRQMTEVMDTSVDPCEDFYQYSCGKWPQVYPSPTKGLEHWTNFVRLDRDNLDLIRDGLEGRGRFKYRTSLMKKVRRFYKVCRARDDEYLEDTREILETLVSDLDFTISKERSARDVSEVIATLIQEFGVFPLFKLSVGINDHNSSQHIIKLDHPELTIPSRDAYMTTKTNATELNKQFLFEYMVDIQKLLAPVSNSSVINSTKQRLVDIEWRLSEGLFPQDEQIKSENKSQILTLKISQLQSKYPWMDWKHFMNVIIVDKSLHTSKEEMEVIISSPDYFSKLSTTMANITASSDGLVSIEKYLTWRLFDNLVQHLSLPFRQARQSFLDKLAGIKPRTLQKVTWRSCIKETGKLFRNALSHIYVKEVAKDDEVIERMTKLFHTFKSSLESIITKSRWMDSVTRKRAVEKSKKIEALIGYSEVVTDQRRLSKQYSSVRVDRSSYLITQLDNIQKKMDPHRMAARLQKPVAKGYWVSGPETINAFYTALLNKVIIPLGILQPPFYNHKRPEVVNYGGIGFSVGHELTHAFDDKGRNYGPEGNLLDWWSPETEAEFLNHSDCLVHQYGSYSIDGKSVNGRSTLGENIADNGGLIVAFKAYFDKAMNQENLPTELPTELPTDLLNRLPTEPSSEFPSGLNLTEKQLFFLGYSQVWCNGNSRNYELKKISTNAHPPSKVRVLATLSNSKEFSHAFNCPLGSKMNPELKCRVW